MNNLHFSKFVDRLGQWRWRLKAANGKVVADSGEGYLREADCDHGIALVMSTNAHTPVYRQAPGLLNVGLR